MGSVHVTTADEIPAAPYYVTMIDPFFSGWGQAIEVGEDTTAVYVAPCASADEAEIVRANAVARGDQEDVRVVTEKPIPGEGQHMMLMSREGCERWYERGAFSGQAS